MTNRSDFTFITNENERNLSERFKALIKDTEFFDVLVGYFYTSGFHNLQESLEKTKRIRILIGIGTNRETADLINRSRKMGLQYSHREAEELFSDELVEEMNAVEDSKPVEEGITKFLQWLISDKMEIKGYPTQNIHAKLYIMSFLEGDRDAGRVITGSSNFSRSGLVDNLEFNVELKNRSDYEFALTEFEKLWEDAVDLKERYIQTIREKTWLNDTVTPYQLYLKFLYEYFKDELPIVDKTDLRYLPEGFKRLEYQEQAVLSAKKILGEYGGVFLSDVVGLGKTYISAMLADQLNGRTLVIAPPQLLDKSNPGSWPNVFSDFKVHADYESHGKLEQLIHRGTEKYKNVFIDESHRFRTDTNVTYEALARICREKRVILVTATPLNNKPLDILNQIKLFQNSKKSTIPNISDLDEFFRKLSRRLKKLDRKEDKETHIRITKENAQSIRENVLKYLMIRRTRKEIETYFAEDLKNQELKFPEIADPEPMFYQLNPKENRIFTETAEMLTRQLKYARYVPMLYYRGEEHLSPLELQSQRNLESLMKNLLVKRLESSFYAFRKTIDRFISYYTLFIREFEKGYVYLTKEYSGKFFELLEGNEEDKIEELVREGRVRQYPSKDFSDELQEDLTRDLRILERIREMWSEVKRDPKLLSFIETLSSNHVLKRNKIIVFTESKETAEYLKDSLDKNLSDETLVFTGSSATSVRETVTENFDASARHPKDDFRILVSTEVLSEGMNLHRSNVVINYDIPWNPTRLMQRVGRVNRLDTAFDKVYTFNFFPTEEANDLIKLKELAISKIQSFITLLGTDARLLTEDETVQSHELFNLLISKETITGEGEEVQSELKYLQIIREIRDKDPDLFEHIKRLPKKARTARKRNAPASRLLTYFRKGNIQKFFLTEDKRGSKEKDFIQTAELLEVKPEVHREKMPADFYDKLGENKQAFRIATAQEAAEIEAPRRGSDNSVKVLKTLKAVRRDTRQYTEDQEAYLRRVMNRLEEGAFPGQTVKTLLEVLTKTIERGEYKPLQILGILQNNIPPELMESHISENKERSLKPSEVILSEYLIGDRHG